MRRLVRSVQDGRIQCVCGSFATTLEEGTSASLIFRPEHIQLSSSGAIEGRVRMVRFLGFRSLILIDVGVTTIRALATPAESNLEGGEVVRFNINKWFIYINE